MADFLLVLVIVLSTIWGYFRGALYNLLGLVALVVAVVGSAPFGGPLGGLLARRWDVSAGPSYLLGRLAAGVLIFASLRVSAWAINRKFGKTRLGVTHRWNRNLGALVGALSGFVTVLIILFVADSIVKAFPEQEGRLVGMARASGLRRMVTDVNPADRFLLTDVLRLLRIARQDPEVTRKLRQRPEIREILEHPDFRRVAQNEELVQAMEQ
ncbi:MAG: CvpA family protein, partial [Candidatus Brocadiia bacterium]